MAAERSRVYASLGVVLFVALSSFFGITRGIPYWAGMMVSVWSQSVLADAVFTLGSAMAATVGFLLAQRRSFLLGLVASLAANWAVYVASFLLLPGAFTKDVVDSDGPIVFVTTWGVVGLAFCALAPPLAALAWERWGARAAA